MSWRLVSAVCTKRRGKIVRVLKVVSFASFSLLDNGLLSVEDHFRAARSTDFVRSLCVDQNITKHTRGINKHSLSKVQSSVVVFCQFYVRWKKFQCMCIRHYGRTYVHRSTLLHRIHFIQRKRTWNLCLNGKGQFKFGVGTWIWKLRFTTLTSRAVISHLALRHDHYVRASGCMDNGIHAYQL